MLELDFTQNLKREIRSGLYKHTYQGKIYIVKGFILDYQSRICIRIVFISESDLYQGQIQSRVGFISGQDSCQGQDSYQGRIHIGLFISGQDSYCVIYIRVVSYWVIYIRVGFILDYLYQGRIHIGLFISGQDSYWVIHIRVGFILGYLH